MKELQSIEKLVQGIEGNEEIKKQLFEKLDRIKARKKEQAVQLNDEQIVKLTRFDKVMNAMRHCVMAEKVEPLRQHIQTPSGASLIMPAAVGKDKFGIKVLSIRPEQETSIEGNIVVYDQKTGKTRGMLQASMITAVRTAAGSTVSASILAPENVEQLAIIGTGLEGAMHLLQMCFIRPSIQRVVLLNRSKERTEQLIKYLTFSRHADHPYQQLASKHGLTFFCESKEASPQVHADRVFPSPQKKKPTLKVEAQRVEGIHPEIATPPPVEQIIQRRAMQRIQPKKRRIQLIVGDHLTRKELLLGSKLICACTGSSTPVLMDDEVSNGTHITAIGSYTLSMRELDESLVHRAAIRIADDSKAVLAESGDFRYSGQQDAQISISGDLGELVKQPKNFPRTPDTITLYKSVGFAAMDVVMANMYIQENKSF